MASRSKSSNAHRPRTASWHKVDIDELVDLMARRTGLSEGEIRQALQELGDTDIYLRSLGLCGEGGCFGDLNLKD